MLEAAEIGAKVSERDYLAALLLVARGFVLRRFWMHIDREEPLLAAQGDADA